MRQVRKGARARVQGCGLARAALYALLPKNVLLSCPTAAHLQVSKTVLRRCMRVLPALRDKLVGAFAAFVVRIQEEHAQVIKDSLNLLLR